MKKDLQLLLLLGWVGTLACAQHHDPVQLNVQEDMNRVEVFIGGDLFTSYRFESSLEKPVLYPIQAPDGTFVTRGFPFDPREKERVDHPHQVGLWFNFGDVNGYDFWNNSYAIPAESKVHYGRIIHRSLEQAETKGDVGVLKVKMDWMAPDNGQAGRLLEESTTYLFKGGAGVWMVDRITTLTAVAEKVQFTDNKEGMLALRVDRSFEMPSSEPVVYTDASGRPTEVAVMDNEGVTGWYLNSEGDEGDEAWGKCARWVKLVRKESGADCSLILMDHPQNINYPACWHARGYGLFSVNNLGRQVYNEKLEKFQLVLEKGGSVTFRHRFVVASGNLSARDVETLYRDFISE
jgi:hypothetical protein